MKPLFKKELTMTVIEGRTVARVAGRSWTLLAVLLAVAPARAETDWVLLLDRSESMIQNDPRNHRFDAQKIMVDLLAQAVEETHRLTLIRFAGTPEVVLDREVISPQNLEKIRKTIVSDPPQGDTDVGAALALARQTVKPEGHAADVHVVLMSDGVQAGRIANLAQRFDAEKNAYAAMGLPVHTILLNDFSISEAERVERRKNKQLYDDRILQKGEELLRELSRATRGRAAQVRSENAVEDIFLELIAPHMSFYREKIAQRFQTHPTDRQLFAFLDREARNLKLRIGGKEIDLDLGSPHSTSGDFEVRLTPFLKRSVLTVKPAENVRWPEFVEFLPGQGQKPATGEVFVISNVRLVAMPGLETDDQTQNGSVKTKVLENEVYPVRFAVLLASGLSPERKRMIEDFLKRVLVRIQVAKDGGEKVDEKTLKAEEVLTGTGKRLYFVPTQLAGETKIKEPVPLVLRASLEVEGTAGRAVARAPERSLVVTPSEFDWLVRRRWKVGGDSAGKQAASRDLDVDFGEEFRLEIIHTGKGALGDAEILANFSKASESAARRLSLKDAGGIPHLFHTDWIDPGLPGEYRAKVTVKTGVVQEVQYRLRVLRDEFAPPRAVAGDGQPSADLGVYFVNERVRFSRLRTIDRLSPEANAKYREAETAQPPAVQVVMKDAGGKWIPIYQAPLKAEPLEPGTAGFKATYAGEVGGLKPGFYAALWPDKRAPAAEPALEPRADRFEIRDRAFAVTLASEDGKPLPAEAGKPTLVAGTPLLVRVTPAESLKDQGLEVAGELTWARKDVGAPQTAKAARAADGVYTLTYPTTDFHTGAAKLRLTVGWKAEKERLVEESHDVFSRPKALGLAMEPLEENVLIGERNGLVRFRVNVIGGRTPEEQRDLRSLWISQPVNATIGDSEEIYRLDLKVEGEALVGSIQALNLPEGTHKLVVKSEVAKLGQDVAACFFNVRPSPFTVKLIQGALGGEPRVLLGAGPETATADSDGAAWVAIAANPAAKDAAGKVASAELKVAGEKRELKWNPGSGDQALLSSEPLALEGLDPDAPLSVAFVDDKGRSFELPLGKLTVTPVPLRHEVAWTNPPPAEMGRGEFVTVRGAVYARGGSRAERERAAEAIRGAKQAFFAVIPPSVLESFQVVAPDFQGTAAARSAFGEQVAFEARLSVRTGDANLRDRFAIEVRAGKAEPLESKVVRIGAAPAALVTGRLDAGGALIGDDDGLAFFARERLRSRIESKGESRGSARLQVLSREGEGDAGLKPVAAADARELDWSPKKEGTHVVRAEVNYGSGSGWSVTEEISITTPLRLAWAAGELTGAVKLDHGQKLPLTIRILGSQGLDWDTIRRAYSLRTEVLATGGQALAVDFTPWEADKASAEGIVLKAFSVKPLTDSAAKVRIALEPRDAKDAAAALDVLEFDLVRGGGSLVIIENFEQGPASYVLRDVTPGLGIAKGSRVRFGYRVGSSVAGGESLKDGVAAAVTGPGGPEKVLGVEASTPALVVFTPFETTDLGTHQLRLEIKGATRLEREFDFNVMKGTTEWALLAAAIAAGVVVAAVLGFLLVRWFGFERDRRVVQDRIDSRKEKALQDLQALPRLNLEGDVRLTLENRSLGPFELNGTPSVAEVEAWVGQHFSMEDKVFADTEKNASRQTLIRSCLTRARTELLAETERRLPIRGTDICVRETKGKNGAAHLEAEVVHDLTQSVPGRAPILSVRLLDGGKLRVSTSAGRSVTLDRDEDLAYNGWIGKKGQQIRASVKVPGVADYATVIIDLK
jgi:hypothetical protein